MMSRKLFLSVVIATAMACDNPPEQEGPIGLGDIMDASTDTDDGSVAPDAGSAPTDGAIAMNDVDAAKPLRKGPAFAVVSSDYVATSVAVLDVQGNIIADDYINSGSAKAGLVTALSGDVELPQRSGETGVMVLIDRFRTDVITRIRLSDGVILGQVKTHTPPTQATMTSYSSNPHDYLYLDEQTAWVTRSEPNLDSTAELIDRGDDLFKLNPSTMTRSGERIDLGVLDSSVVRTDPGTGTMTTVPLYTRPSRMVRVGNTVVVGIARTAFDFKAVGDGIVALVDLDSKVVTGFPLDGLKNCNDVAPIPDDSDSVLVTCGGDFTAADSRLTAGILILGISNGTAKVEHVWRAKDSTAPIALTGSTIALGGTLVGAGANDYSGMSPDVFALLDVATGKSTQITAVTAGKGVFGTPAYDVDAKVLLLPDASRDSNKKPTAGVRRFQRHTDDSFTELSTTKVAVSSNMPVRSVFPL